MLTLRSHFLLLLLKFCPFRAIFKNNFLKKKNNNNNNKIMIVSNNLLVVISSHGVKIIAFNSTSSDFGYLKP